MSRTALLTVITGQDGAYLSRFCSTEDTGFWGLFEEVSTLHLWRLHQLGVTDADVELIPFELLEYANVRRAHRASCSRRGL